MLTGLDNLVTMLRGTKNISEYYIKAYTIITDKHRRAMIVGALSSHLSEAVLCEVLADNRVPLNLPTIDAELRAEMEYIVGVKSKIWQVFAGVCGSSLESLEGECIRATLTRAGFCEMRLRPARCLPWSLVVDTKVKLQALRWVQYRWLTSLRLAADHS